MRKRKGGDEEKPTLDARTYPMVSVGMKSPLVHVIEALKKSIASRPPSLLQRSLNCRKG